MRHFSIDINADLGEGMVSDAQLMPFISSCNIACGGHAGNIDTIRKTVRLAKLHEVKIGAHPSFPDTKNFGRMPMDISSNALFKSLTSQINTLQEVLEIENVSLHHIKPHGALYNQAAKDLKTATVIIEVIKSLHLPVCLYVPYNSVIATIAIKNEIPVMYEAFADRNYNDDLSLVSRHKDDAILHEEDDVIAHVYRMISEGIVKTITGKMINIKAQTFCVHGDHPRVLALVRSLVNNLKLKGVHIQ